MGEAAALTPPSGALVIDTVLATGLTVTVGISAADHRRRRRQRRAGRAARRLRRHVPAAHDLRGHRGRAARLLRRRRRRRAADRCSTTTPRPPPRPAAGADRRPARASPRSRSAPATRAGSRSILELTDDSRCSSAATTGRSRATPPAPWAGCPASPTSCPAECLELERHVPAGDLAAARALWPRLAPLSPPGHGPAPGAELQGRAGPDRPLRRPDAPAAAPPRRRKAWPACALLV